MPPTPGRNLEGVVSWARRVNTALRWIQDNAAFDVDNGGFIATSRGVKDKGQAILLDAGGKIDESMIDDSDVDHGSTTGLGDDDHTQYVLSKSGSTRAVVDLTASPTDDHILFYDSATGEHETTPVSADNSITWTGGTGLRVKKKTGAATVGPIGVDGNGCFVDQASATVAGSMPAAGTVVGKVPRANGSNTTWEGSITVAGSGPTHFDGHAWLDTSGTATLKVSSGGVWKTVDHGTLDGLSDDDHTQYHNNTRGDARYSLTTDLASTANTKGASLIGIEDSARYTAAGTVEAALAELYLSLGDSIVLGLRRSGTWTAGQRIQGWTDTTDGFCRLRIPSGTTFEVTMVGCHIQNGSSAGTYAYRAGVTEYASDSSTGSATARYAVDADEWTDTTTGGHYYGYKRWDGVTALASVTGGAAISILPFLMSQSSSPGTTTSDNCHVIVIGRFV